jgi:hypothetical protein
MDEALWAIDEINADYQSHCRGALEIARDYFDARIVLTKLLREAGVSLPGSRAASVIHE